MRKSWAPSRARSSRSLTSRSSRCASPSTVRATGCTSGAGGDPVGQRLGEPGDRGQRGAQLVADRQQELPLPALAGRQRRGQRVERVGDLGDLGRSLRRRPGRRGRRRRAGARSCAARRSGRASSRASSTPASAATARPISSDSAIRRTASPANEASETDWASTTPPTVAGRASTSVRTPPTSRVSDIDRPATTCRPLGLGQRPAGQPVGRAAAGRAGPGEEGEVDLERVELVAGALPAERDRSVAEPAAAAGALGRGVGQRGQRPAGVGVAGPVHQAQRHQPGDQHRDRRDGGGHQRDPPRQRAPPAAGASGRPAAGPRHRCGRTGSLGDSAE